MKPILSIFAVTALFGACTAQTQAAVALGTAADFGVLAATTITNTGNTTVVGNIGVYNGTAITGFFGTTENDGPGTFTGTAHQGDITAQQAQADALAAFNALNGLAVDSGPIAVDLGGQTLSPGVYNLGTAEMTGTLILDGAGDYVFQIDSTLITAASSSISLINGADASDVFWAVGSSATLGAGTDFSGTIIANVSAGLTTGATLDGRVIALTGAVTLNNNTIIPEPAVTSLLAIMSLGLIGRRHRARRMS